MSFSISMNHGGQLKQASQQYNIPVDQWLDLSTGISPFVYPLPAVPNTCWQRLPEQHDGLEASAAEYYGSSSLLPVAGSQEAIQGLPKLFQRRLRVGIIKPSYHSHQKAWEHAGHEVVLLDAADIDKGIATLDVLLLVNPNNPSTRLYHKAELLRWHRQLCQRNAYLIVDEAFIDTTPEHSLIEEEPQQGLVVLRSIGKFFGLAGIRLGFVWAQEEILQQLAKQQNDWSVSHPARWAGKQALADTAWQHQQRVKLRALALRLSQLLMTALVKKVPESRGVVFNTDLFAYLATDKAADIHHKLAKQGILIRLFTESSYQNNALRFGLPATESEWQRLEAALSALSFE